MAQQNASDSPPEIVNDEEQRLKYLEGVQSASLHAIACVSNLYEYVKEKSGPLKPGVQTVEGTVKSVVGPAYDKFHDVPSEVLKLVDRNVDRSMTGLKQRVPASIKEASTRAVSAAQNAPAVVSSVASEVKKINVTDTASGYAKEMYAKYEPAAEQCAASTWRKLNQLPVFPKVAEAVIPTAATCVEKYNQTVQSTAEKGYKISSYLPLVPTEKMAKVFGDPDADVTPVEPPAAAAPPGKASSVSAP
uniref:Uncharacterized protein n=1 Tax=Kalanchoe fedtschenkoi TaxID=63787 RepID=A0A7N0R838_KALFE